MGATDEGSGDGKGGVPAAVGQPTAALPRRNPRSTLLLFFCAISSTLFPLYLPNLKISETLTQTPKYKINFYTFLRVWLKINMLEIGGICTVLDRPSMQTSAPLMRESALRLL